MTNPCPLCNSTADIFYEFKKQLYFQCVNCRAIFMAENLRPNPESEKSRYEEHINDVNDEGYQRFVSPITEGIMHDFKPGNKGLDFGAGTGPVISKVLKDNGYSILQYDPFFHNHPELLEQKYDYIACCEVIEHFYNPKKEFVLLRKLLRPNSCVHIP